MTALHWGVHDIGPAIVRARDRLGATTLDGPLGGAAELRVYAGAERMRRIVAPLRTRPVLGSQVTRERGEGIEFADLRPLAPGDRVRSINWRATARRRAPYVNLQHPEHSADVVLFLDTFAEAEGTLDTAVRAAAALASSYLARRDRVALVSLGGELSWLIGSPGTRQLYRILDALFSSQVRPSFRWTGVTHVPRRLLPARALVIALSPLLDERGIAALLDLRARGYDLVVLEISPPAEGDTPALRLWRLQRDALRSRFEALGIPIAPTIEEVIALRRRAQRMIAAYAAIALAALAGGAAAGAPAAIIAALLVAVALVTGRGTPVLGALVLLGVAYVTSDGGPAIPSPLYAGMLLLMAELAFWSLDEREAGRVEPGTGAPRLRAILAVAATGVAASALVLLASEANTERSPETTAAGVAAVLGCVGVLVALTRSHRMPG